MFTGGGRLQVYALPERAGLCSCTLAVSSVSREAVQLEKLGIVTGVQMGEQVKVFMVKDSDGNSIAFTQAPDVTLGREAAGIARAAFEAFVSEDRAAIEALIADDFHFSSPLDRIPMIAAESRSAVHAFHRSALDAGGTDHGAPGDPKDQTTPTHYAAFVLDPVGNNIEAVFRGE